MTTFVLSGAYYITYYWNVLKIVVDKIMLDEWRETFADYLEFLIPNWWLVMTDELKNNNLI